MDLRDTLLARVDRLLQLGKNEEAIALAEAGVSEAPKNPNSWVALALANNRTDRTDTADAAFRKAVEFDPDNPRLVGALCDFLMSHRRFREAAKIGADALEKKPDEELAVNLITNLSLLCDPIAALEAANRWHEYFPQSRRVASMRLILLTYPSDFDEAKVYAAHREYARQIEAIIPRGDQFYNSRKIERKLQIGYVSEYFARHVTSNFLLGIIEDHNRDEVYVSLYSTGKKPDSVTEKYRAIADRFRDLGSASVADVADKIRGDKIDILVDLDGATSVNGVLLFARRPAPVQVNYLGYPFPTCLRTMNYRIVDTVTDSPNDPAPLGSDFVEEHWRMEGHFLCFQPESTLPAVKPLPTGPPVFGSFNNSLKVSDACLALWAGVLKAVPDSKLLLKYRGFDDTIIQARVIRILGSKGIARERIDLRGATATYEDHLKTYDELFVSLDSMPYNGTTTTYEALAMGTPVVALEGNTHRGRVGASILTHLGRKEWVAKTTVEFADICKRLVGDREKLNAARIGLREVLYASPICDTKDFTRRIEEAYREMWEKHLEESS